MLESVDRYRFKILPLREQVRVHNRWLEQRLDRVLPELMRREGFDMWIVVAREYNEDPVVMTLLPQPAMSARRRTILVFSLQPDGRVDRLALDRYGFGDLYRSAWNPDEEEQHACLARVVAERQPQVIGLNVCQTFALGDGLTHSEHERIAAALGDELMGRVRGAGRLCIGWLERRIKAERIVYPGIVEMGHALIAEAFSSRVIQPGVTTTEDVAWWMRQTIADLGLYAWFQPDVEIQAQGQRFDAQDKRELILPGDVLHCDVGFVYLGLATDQQQNAYVLKPGERDVPPGLKEALTAGNRLQDIHAEEMVLGRTGNEVLRAALDKAKAKGLQASIYTHPLGYHGHAAGPTIG
ncbi:MAG: M24 family metallopeptidase, partial [Anaerolineae bacterium]|nr:M24 family metallopeptidase [Anaerolineae bacterium]